MPAWTPDATLRSQIVGAVQAALQSLLTAYPAWGGLTAAHIHRNALRPIESDQLPALVVYSTRNDPADKGLVDGEDTDRFFKYEATVRVEIRVIGEPVDEVVDPFVKFIRRAVFADPSLGGLTMGCREEAIIFDGVVKDKAYAAAAFDLVFLYGEESWPDLTVPPPLTQATFDNDPFSESLVIP